MLFRWKDNFGLCGSELLKRVQLQILCNWKKMIKNFCFSSTTAILSCTVGVFQTFHLPRTFIPLLNCSDLFTVNCGGALVLLVGTGTLVDTVWIWTRGKENNKTVGAQLTYESDSAVYGGWKLSVRLLPAENRPAPGSLGKDFGWDPRGRPRWTPHRSSFPVRG